MSTLSIIKKNQNFQTVFKQGHSIYGRYMVVYFLPNEQNVSRFGFCVGKKIGSAVIRNHVKRWFREATHKIEFCVIPGWDIVVVARHLILNSDLARIIEELTHILSKASVLALTKRE